MEDRRKHSLKMNKSISRVGVGIRYDISEYRSTARGEENAENGPLESKYGINPAGTGSVIDQKEEDP